MRKGEVRKQEIVRTAERLFFEKGYENTSVQDILDALDMSKGGFYHYFESKQQLLEIICDERAREACAAGAAAVAAETGGALRRLNALFSANALFGEGGSPFLSLMIKTAFRGELSDLRNRLRRTMIELYAPIADGIVFEGIDEGVFYSAFPERVGTILTMLAADLVDEAARLLSTAGEDRGDLTQLFEILNAYRRSTELILNAPRGSVELLDTERIQAVLKTLAIEGRRGVF